MLLALCAGCAVPQPRGSGRLARIVEPRTRRGYWLYLPKDYVEADAGQRSTRRWPLVVTFHGMVPFDGARAQALEWEQEADRYGFIVVAPELRAFHLFGQFPLRTVNAAFSSDEEATLAILEHVFQTTAADPGNVLATSWSSGGYLAHYMLNRHPERFTCLAVRQSNFSAGVLDPDMTRRSAYHPVLIINTQNDFPICQRESRQAVQWYETHGYKNDFWVRIKDKGHERTPDLAAYFFALVCGAQPNSAPAVLVKRQAIDGNPEGIAFLSGKLAGFESAPPSALAARRSVAGPGGPPPARRDSLAKSTPLAGAGRARISERAAAIPERLPRRSPLRIRLSSAIGIAPLHLSFSAECPADWRNRADFLWMLDGQAIGSGTAGHKTLAEPGTHTLSLLVVTSGGQEHRAKRVIRVLPRLDTASRTGRDAGE